MAENLGRFNPGKEVTNIIELRYQRLPRVFGSVILLGLLFILACTTSQARMRASDNYQEMFDVNLFHERVKLIHSMQVGATREDILKTLGKPQVREVRPDGSTILTYRVRCYMGPEPLSRWPRHMSATYETRFILDPQGRVRAVQTKP